MLFLFSGEGDEGLASGENDDEHRLENNEPLREQVWFNKLTIEINRWLYFLNCLICIK